MLYHRQERPLVEQNTFSMVERDTLIGRVRAYWWNKHIFIGEIQSIRLSDQNERFMMLVFADHLVITGKNTYE